MMNYQNLAVLVMIKEV